MKRSLFVLLTLLLSSLPAAAQRVNIDYDADFDFSELETFAWKDVGKPSMEESNPLLHQYLVDQLVAQLESAGLRQVDENPDFYVTYHGQVDTELRIDTEPYGYRYGRAWRWSAYYSYGPATTTVRRYEEGTLIIDAWNGETDELIWRGTATGTVRKNPKQARKAIDRALAKIVKRWDKEHRSR